MPQNLQSVDTLMFDFYGTVVDMQGGLVRAISPFLEARGYEGEPSNVVTWWRRTHFENSMIDALLTSRAHAVSRDRSPCRSRRH